MASHFETKNKFSVSNPKVGSLFSEDQFFKWSDDNIYRTSTNDMSGKVIYSFINQSIDIVRRPQKVICDPWVCRL
jgi:hypothetical protein